MALTVAVQMDALHAINPASDSTLALLYEAQARGHALLHYTPDRLSCENGEVFAYVRPLRLHDGEAFYALGEEKKFPLAKADVVLMRQDPPFDMTYITACHFLEMLPASVRVVNDPASVRRFPEKMFPLLFKDAMPPTLISADPRAIRDFHAAQPEMVLKPLYGYGGRGVFRVRREGENLEALLEMIFSKSSEAWVAQAFLPEVASGDRRIFFIHGEVAGAFGRTPQAGDIRANMRVGGTPVSAKLSPRQQSLCDKLGPVLKEHGIALAGVDLIGDYLTEINITSPTGLRALERLYGTNPAAMFWDGLS